MEFENRKSYFIRDLIVRVLLIVLFIFLLMFLFPMPNLTPFYDAIFNNNVQTMKEAAEKWYTTDRMPENEGDTEKLTLQEMLDKKLVLPFVDKNGNACDANKSYVSVRKSGDEYVMKVSLTCGSQTDYIIEHIGCYNFCKDGKCVAEPVAKTEEVPVTPAQKTYKCAYINGQYWGSNYTVVDKTTYENQCIPKNPEPSYSLEYEYQRVHNTEKWTLLDWQDSKMTETKDLVKVDEQTKYTGQKKVVENTLIYRHVKEEVINNWTKDEEWLDEEKDTSDQSKIRLYAVRTLYTGNKTTTETQTKYQHVRIVTEDGWTDLGWTVDYIVPNNTTVLTDTRYTLRKTTATDTTGYVCGDWKNDNTWYTTKPNDTEKIEWGEPYDSRTRTVAGKCTDWQKDGTWRTSKPSDTATKKWGSSYDSKTEKVQTGTSSSTSCGSWQKDGTWRTSKPANSNGKEWGSSYDSKTESTTSSTYDKIVTTTTPMTNDNNYVYKLFKKEQKACTTACNGQAVVTYYYYYRYPKVTTTYYKYYYRTCTTQSNPTYKEVKYYKYYFKTCDEDTKVKEYKYKYKECTKKTDTTTDSDTKVVYSIAERDKYTKEGYTLIKTEYRYKSNNPTYTSDSIWTDSIESPEGYTYNNRTSTVTKYVKTSLVTEDNKTIWVTNKEALGEYTEDITTRKQYKYYYNNPTIKESEIWTDSKISPEGYTFKNREGDIKVADSKTKYIDLGEWVDSKSELGEYTYNVQEVSKYRYKKRTYSSYTETAWFKSNPGGDWKPTGNSRRVQN